MPLLSCSSTRNYLRPFGYGTLALPKAGVQPLTMLAKRDGRLTSVGPLAGTFKQGPVALPSTTRNRASTISGARTTSLDASLALDVVGLAIGALAGSTLGFKAAYKDAKKVEFEFGDVFDNSIDINALDTYLANSPPTELAGPAIRDLLDRDKIFVMVSTLDARQISVKATNSSGVELGLQVPVVQELVGGKVSVASTSGNESMLTYSSTDLPLAIGAQVVRLIFDGSTYRSLKLVAAGDAEFGITGAATDGEGEPMPVELIDL